MSLESFPVVLIALIREYFEPLRCIEIDLCKHDTVYLIDSDDLVSMSALQGFHVEMRTWNRTASTQDRHSPATQRQFHAKDYQQYRQTGTIAWKDPPVQPIKSHKELSTYPCIDRTHNCLLRLYLEAFQQHGYTTAEILYMSHHIGLLLLGDWSDTEYGSRLDLRKYLQSSNQATSSTSSEFAVPMDVILILQVQGLSDMIGSMMTLMSPQACWSRNYVQSFVFRGDNPGISMMSLNRLLEQHKWQDPLGLCVGSPMSPTHSTVIIGCRDETDVDVLLQTARSKSIALNLIVWPRIEDSSNQFFESKKSNLSWLKQLFISRPRENPFHYILIHWNDPSSPLIEGMTDLLCFLNWCRMQDDLTRVPDRIMRATCHIEYTRYADSVDVSSYFERDSE